MQPSSVITAFLDNLASARTTDRQESPMTDLNPVEWDTITYALMIDEAKAKSLLDRAVSRMHLMAGDKKVTTGSFGRRTTTWQLTDTQAQAKVAELAIAGDEENYYLHTRPSAVLADVDSLEDQIDALDEQIAQREDVWEQHRWSRWFPCNNADGHIHVSMHGCKTVRWDTDMGWEPSLSGHTVEEAIKQLGPRLCSVCFPDAPVEHCRSLRDITRAEREAEKARKAAEKQAALEAKEQRKADRAAAAEAKRAGRGVTPQQLRIQGVQGIYRIFNDNGPDTDREMLALAVEGLAELGRSQNWKDVIAFWAKMIRDEENPLVWAVNQGGINTSQFL